MPVAAIILLTALGALLLMAIASGGNAGGGTLADFIATITGRGSRVGDQTSLDDNGIVTEDPDVLAAGAGLSLDIYALARMISSEEGNSPTVNKIAVAWAAVNASKGQIAAKLLAGTGPGDGTFKRQGYSDTAGGHHAAYASTAADPYDDDVNIATAVIGGTIPDNTGGATNFFNPALEDSLFAQGRTSVDADGLRAKWAATGLVPVVVAGIDDSRLQFFRSA